jgi:hypothetical protein
VGQLFTTLVVVVADAAHKGELPVLAAMAAVEMLEQIRQQHLQELEVLLILAVVEAAVGMQLLLTATAVAAMAALVS